MSSHGRCLVLMRHAKAEAFAAVDSERALTARGRADATEAGTWLTSAGIRPDHALVSSAVRTRQSWEAVSEGLHGATEVELSDPLRTASPDTMLDLLRGVSPDCETLLVLGHNPTVAYVAHLLDDGTGEDEAFVAMTAGFPTAAISVLEVPVAWSDLAEQSCRTLAFHVGRADTSP